MKRKLKMTVCHMSSVHPRDDVRVFQKQCRTLVEAGYDVTLVVADGLGGGEDSGVVIVDVGRRMGRFGRILVSAFRVYCEAKKMGADLYHFHDPELLPYGVLLKISGYRVVYDSHEDFPRALLGKDWIPMPFRRGISYVANWFEEWCVGRFSGVIGATPRIASRFADIAPVSNINNYPILKDYEFDPGWENKKDEFCFTGGISKERGIIPLINAAAKGDYRFNLVGRFVSDKLREEVKALAGWEKVNEVGWVGRSEVNRYLRRSKVGILNVFHIPNAQGSQPNKLFEYLAAGIPVIHSNNPHWEMITDRHKCGISVDPSSADELAAAIAFIMSNSREAEEMGMRGRSAVFEYYSWEAEAVRLLEFYEEILT